MTTGALIKPIVLGNKTYASNLIQAPLAGVSCAPFRELIWHFGGPAYCVTEMISAKTLLLKKPPKRYIYKSPSEGPLCYQLSGDKPEELKQAAIIAVNQHGADLIDLNCGCPVGKIRKKNCGSKLLAQSQKLYELTKAMKEGVDVPVSIKIRVDGDSGDQFNTDVVKAINDAGADFIIVHGRNWRENYETPVRLDEIAAITSASSIPVIGNGNVKDYQSLKDMFKHTNCAGIMIGRASCGQPWLFQKLIHEDKNEAYAIPTNKQIGEYLLQYLDRLIELENETQAMQQARTLSKYYLRNIGLSETTHLQFFNTTSKQELADLVRSVFI